MQATLLFLVAILAVNAWPNQPGACGGPNGYTALNGTANPHKAPLANPNLWTLSGVPTKISGGSAYDITLNGPTTSELTGFLFAAYGSDNVGVGSWSDKTGYSQNVACGTQAAAVPWANVTDGFKVTSGVVGGHTQKFNDLATAPTTFTITWTAPATVPGTVSFGAIAIVDVDNSYVTPVVMSSSSLLVIPLALVAIFLLFSGL